MRTLAIVLAALILPASALAGGDLRVDRPSKGGGAKVTTVKLLHGFITARTRAVVLTDTRCSPDARGVSHCLNRMRLADGTVVTAQHDHRMTEMPCLSPGEPVRLTPRRQDAGYWSNGTRSPRSAART
jgi:hypothetical protein